MNRSRRETRVWFAFISCLLATFLLSGQIRSDLTASATAPFTNTPRLAELTPALPTDSVGPASLTLVRSPEPDATLVPSLKVPTVVLYQSTNTKPQVTAIPTHVARIKANGNDILNIALLGTNSIHEIDPTDAGYQTDTILIVSINRTTNSVAMLSIPRDLFVYIPSLGMERIEDAYSWGEAVHWQPGGGFGLLQQTILYNLGFPVHYFAKIGFGGFKTIVDTLNGVDLAVDCPVSDLRFQGKLDAQQTPVYEPFTLAPGYYHMDGSLALWYARMRRSTSDFDRSRRQQQLLRAILRTARSQGLIQKAPELWGQLTSLVQTDMQLSDVLSLIPLALSLKPSDITDYYMHKDVETVHWTTSSGGVTEDVQLPKPDGLSRMINNFYTPPSPNRLGLQAPSVEIVNGTSTVDYQKVAADRLLSEGFDVQDKGPGTPTARSAVYDLTGSAEPAALNSLLKALNVRPDQVISQPDPNRMTDFRVVIGNDYNSCAEPGFTR